jgi:ankyrin repeat protein
MIEELTSAITKNNINKINELISFINFNYYSNNTALHVATKYNRLNIAKLLISYGVDVNYGKISLKNAIINDNYKMVKLLVSQGADIHVDDDEALRWASLSKDLKIVKYLISKGAKVRVLHRYDNYYDILHWAISSNKSRRLNMVKYLISQGAYINTDKLLNSSMKFGHTDVVNFIKEM